VSIEDGLEVTAVLKGPVAGKPGSYRSWVYALA